MNQSYHLYDVLIEYVEWLLCFSYYPPYIFPEIKLIVTVIISV